jgi:MFS transporter, FSR family, fosmidomycin resistance protein
MAGLATITATRNRARRTLIVAGFAHALHDGYTDLIYLLLPVWQAEFALGYGVLALVRGLYTGAMAGLQIPVSRVSERLGGRGILAFGTALAGCGYALAGISGGLLTCFVGGGLQHAAYAARGPLGIYNFSGDLGKAAIPAATSVLLTLMPWRSALYVLAALGIAVAIAVALLLPVPDRTHRSETSKERRRYAGKSRGGFPLLFAIGVLDSAVRMGFLTFLPYIPAISAQS